MIFEKARGLDQLQRLIGSSLTCINRYILSFGVANDFEGHGITELRFGESSVSIYPGQNEDFIEIREGSVDASNLAILHWTKFEISKSEFYSKYLGQILSSVSVFADSGGDRALLLAFIDGSKFCIYYEDTDLNIANGALTNIMSSLKERKVLR